MTETCPNCGEELTSDNAAGGLCGRCLLERGIELTNTVAVADGSTPGTHPFAAPDPVEVEADLLSFDVLELIGQGGMGAVYKAYQRTLDRTVAIKILPRQATGGHEFAERFQREARALARLRHENIVMAYDYGLTDRYLYSVMEYVGGPNLRQYLRSQTVEPRRALEIARDVCAALQFAHENGVVHRDIKPENILLDDSGRVKIADFGLAKLLQPDPRELALTHTRHFMGTVHYMAPEQSERPHDTDHRADIYSVGVVLYEMLTGELPLGRFDPPSCRAGVDERIDDLVFRALEKDPARRYDTAASFGAAITSLLHDGAMDSCSPVSGESERWAKPQAIKSSSFSDRGRPRRGPLIAAGFFAFLVVAYFGWQFLLKYQRDKDGNTTLTVEAKGGEEAASKSVVKGSTSMRASDAPSKSESAKTTKRRKSTDASDTGGLIGPVQIEYLEGLDQIVLRGDPEDVRRTIELIKQIEGHVQGKQNETPEDLIRRLRDSGAKDKPGAPQTEQLLQVFQLKYVKASEITDELRTILGTDAGRFEPDNRTNSIIALADRESMSRVQALLKRLDQSGAEQSSSKVPESLSDAYSRVTALEAEIEIFKADLNILKTSLGQFDKREDTPHSDLSQKRAREEIEKTESRLKSLQAEKATAEQDLARLKSRIEAIDSGSYPEALLMREVRSNPEMVELQRKITEATDLYRKAKSIAKYPQSDQAVERAAARIKELKEREGQLIAELRQYELAKLRFGNGSPPGSATRLNELQTRVKALQEETANLRSQLEQKGRDLLAATAREAEHTNERKTRNAEADRTTTNQLSNEVSSLSSELVRAENQLSIATREQDRLEARQDQVKIFQLENSKASEADQMLRKLYPDNSAVRMTVDNRTNSLIVEGDRETLTVIEAILLRLDESGSSNADDGPTTITRGHVLRISAAGTSPEAPIDGRYNIDLDGYVNLGAAYGKVKVVGLTAQQAQDAILKKLRETLREPKVVVSIEQGSTPQGSTGRQVDPKDAGPIHILKDAHALRISVSGTVKDAPIDGLYTLDLDGYVNLGAEYGKVKVAGMTADQAQEAILTQLREILSSPSVVVTIEPRIGRKEPDGAPPAKTDEADQSSANRATRSPTMTLSERGWELKLDLAGRVMEARQLPAEQWASRVDSELANRWRKLLDLKKRVELLGESNASSKTTPEGKKLDERVQLLRSQMRLLESNVGGPATQTTYPPRDPTHDNEVAIFDLPHHSTQIVDQWPKRDADLPIGLRYSEDVRKEFGKLAVEYRFYDHLPITKYYRGERGDEQLVIAYMLVIKGPQLGRMEYVLSSWPRLDPNQKLDRTPGIIFLPGNLKINNGEPLEIYIERFDPHSDENQLRVLAAQSAVNAYEALYKDGNAAGPVMLENLQSARRLLAEATTAARVRVSNIVNVTWELPNQPRRHDSLTELDPKENQPSKQPTKESTPE